MSADNNNDNNGDGCENYENDGLENVVGNVSVTAHPEIMAKTMSIYR